jgi:hypothetical protein
MKDARLDQCSGMTPEQPVLRPDLAARSVNHSAIGSQISSATSTTRSGPS